MSSSIQEHESPELSDDIVGTLLENVEDPADREDCDGILSTLLHME